MAREILTNYDFKGVGRILNLPEASADNEPVTLAQLKAMKEEFIEIDSTNAVDGSVPVYNEQNKKFLATQSTTTIAITDGGNF